jgi:hypothetical protein
MQSMQHSTITNSESNTVAKLLAWQMIEFPTMEVKISATDGAHDTSVIRNLDTCQSINSERRNRSKRTFPSPWERTNADGRVPNARQMPK